MRGFNFIHQYERIVHMKNQLIVFIFFVSVCLFSSCGNSGMLEDKSGLKYKFFNRNDSGKKPENSDILVLNIKYTTKDDSVLFNSSELSGPFRMRMKEKSHDGGCIEDAFAMMHVGDSAYFEIDGINFFEKTKKTEAPGFIKHGEMLKFYVKLIRILKSEDFENEARASSHANEAEEMKLLENYLQNANITVKPELSGLFFIEHKKGTGECPKKGQKVKLHYTGTFVDGMVFDNSLERNKPFTFTVGENQAIQGLEEGVIKMKKGGTAMLIIPSKLAYGGTQTHNIPPYSTLIFEIEILDIY